MSPAFPIPLRADIEAADRRTARFVLRTPLVRSTWLSEATQSDVWLKLEAAQTTGSFKIRGAVNAIARLKETSPHVKVVVTASAGNHGIALAWAASQFGLAVRVHVATTAPAAKREALTRLGAAVVDAVSYDAAETAAREEAASSGAPYISPYNDPDVIAGAGTVALEMLSDRDDLDTIVVPLGGGGLLSGTAIVARSPGIQRRTRRGDRKTPIRLIGAEAEASPVFTAALSAGHTIPVRVLPTIADGLAGNLEPGSQTFEIVRDLVDRVELVAEPSIEMAMKGLAAREHLIAEGAAATAVGALLQGGLELTGHRVGVIVSGRNVDPEVLRRVL